MTGCDCDACGRVRHEIGQDVSEVLDYVPGTFHVVRHVRPKLACKSCSTITQALAPSRPIDRCMAGAGLHAHVLVSKYCDHTPLYRLCQIYAREGVDLQRSTLADWVAQAARLLSPLAEAIGRYVLAADKIHSDDTPSHLPRTRIDILTNGRAFHDPAFAHKLGRVEHPDLTLGIPLYSDGPVRHDYVVQASGAFNGTVRDILNLRAAAVRVEIRVVVHRETLPRLVQTCRFIARILLFVHHVALMGLEITGFTRANLNKLCVDPHEYRDTLSEAADVLVSYGIKASIYNHQLCLVNDDLQPIYRKSISDWKTEYLDECTTCERRSDCGGFFSSAIQFRHSAYIRPIRANEPTHPAAVRAVGLPVIP